MKLIPCFLQNPTASHAPHMALLFNTSYRATRNYDDGRSPPMLPYAPQSLQGLLRVDDPSATSLITIPESTVITRRVDAIGGGELVCLHPIPSHPISTVLLSPYPSSIQHRHTLIHARKDNATKPSAFVCDKELGTRNTAYQMVEKAVALVEPDIKCSLPRSFVIPGQDKGYRASDCGKDGDVVQDAWRIETEADKEADKEADELCTRHGGDSQNRGDSHGPRDLQARRHGGDTAATLVTVALEELKHGCFEAREIEARRYGGDSRGRRSTREVEKRRHGGNSHGRRDLAARRHGGDSRDRCSLEELD
ncbi:hypothetical protein M422DRAFT_780722 [Sphaerobolus stellatus SS14]|uniref:Uncharacterized protein n=1 Tax=Sphaerobolus stellatus (strain SS14) TaxID=990650 RepID=A0A0C9VGC9_SPHS4|nr:hypothetical protein M422DRAFT_780722 [Sphaerobolus stellatus SS14]